MPRRGRKSVPLQVASVIVLIAAVGGWWFHSLTVAGWWALAAWCWYFAFIKRMPCRAETAQGERCRNNARGFLNGCWIIEHKEAKRDRQFRLVTGLRNPFALLRAKWRRDPLPTTRRTSTGSAPMAVPQTAFSPPSRQTVQERAMLIMTAVSMVAAVISAWKA